MYNRKSENGITLVALVITIIVLLILAGVTIAMVVGDNGIITRSNEAKDETAKAEEMEEIQLAAAASKMNTEGEVDADYLETELNKLIGKGTIVGNIAKKGENEALPWEVKGATGRVYRIDGEGVVSVLKESSSTPAEEEIAAAEDFEEEMSNIFGNDYDIVDITPSEISAEYIYQNWIKQFSTNESSFGYSEEKGGELCVPRANNYYALYSNTPIDFTNIDRMEIDVVNWTNNYCASAFYLGVQSTRELDENFYKSTNTEFSTATSYDVNNKETLTLDTSDLTGTYFIKIMCKHNADQAFNAHSAFNSLRLYGDLNSSTVYKVRTIDFSTDENCALFEGYHSRNSNNELNINKTNNGEFFISCSYADTYAVVRLKEKLDFSRIDYIMVDMHGSNDGGGAYPTNIIGLESEKQNTTSFDTAYTTTKSGSNFSYWKSFLDLTNVTGEYYFKFTTQHSSSPAAYTTNTSINSIQICYH